MRWTVETTVHTWHDVEIRSVGNGQIHLRTGGGYEWSIPLVDVIWIRQATHAHS